MKERAGCEISMELSMVSEQMKRAKAEMRFFPDHVQAL